MSDWGRECAGRGAPHAKQSSARSGAAIGVRASWRASPEQSAVGHWPVGLATVTGLFRSGTADLAAIEVADLVRGAGKGQDTRWALTAGDGVGAGRQRVCDRPRLLGLAGSGGDCARVGLATAKG